MSDLAALVPWALSGDEGFWWACILFAASLPVLAVGVVLVPVLAGWVVERPYLWAMTGAACSVALAFIGAAFTGQPRLGFFALFVAVPAMVVFMAVARWRPLWWPTDRV